jgi:hypothetical protein
MAEECYGKKVYTKLCERINEKPKGAFYFSPYEAKLVNMIAGKVEIDGERCVVFIGCAKPKCNCDFIEKWYSKDYE